VRRTAHRTAREDVRVVLFERDERVGRSILATGNGRCNFSNAHVAPDVYRNERFVAAALAATEARAAREIPSQRKSSTAYPTAVLGFFSDLGLLWREEAEGRLYPLANKASVVLDVLRAAAAAASVEERVNAEVVRVEPPRAAGRPFTLRMADGAFERADAVIAACGGTVARDLLPGVVKFHEMQPVLGPLATDARLVRQLDNIRVKGAVSLRRAGKELARERGEIMFRKYGVSGVCVFNLSRLARPGDELLVDFVPWVRAVDMEAFLNARRKRLMATRGTGAGALTCGDFLRGMVLPQVAHVLLQSAGLREEDAYTRDTTPLVAQLLKGFALRVEGIGDARQCQVHRGGFDVGGFDARSCEARALPGLFAAGEALDVDAPCGGYNLHWAWSSGMLAGWNAVDRVLGEPSGEGVAR
ncbi:MAG: aminoacetone oxidase family FAD-binding enzyme, partial [Eggerthellaceae bacterium]|nr:aminoacetone oxidase family FAD-binding enzyme [Eggerthellaceae bacterium]